MEDSKEGLIKTKMDSRHGPTHHHSVMLSTMDGSAAPRRENSDHTVTSWIDRTSFDRKLRVLLPLMLIVSTQHPLPDVFINPLDD